MPFFKKIPDQQPILCILNTFLKKDTIPHALLFTGINGIGKRTCAEAFAMACNCINKYDIVKARSLCTCRSCQKILSGSHPDLIYVKPSRSLIKIVEIRKLCDTIALKSFEAILRFVIISEAHKMNKEASNALLKVLEEPPDRTMFILTAMHTSGLLPTVVSRCRHIRFNPISTKNIETFMVNQHGVNHKSAKATAQMAYGSLSRAELLKQEEWIKHRKWILNELGTTSFKPIGRLLVFVEKIYLNKAMLLDSFEIIKTWFRDLGVYKFCPDKIINKDMMDKIEVASKNFKADTLFEKIYAVESVERKISSNINIRLALEILILA